MDRAVLYPSISGMMELPDFYMKSKKLSTIVICERENINSLWNHYVEISDQE